MIRISNEIIKNKICYHSLQYKSCNNLRIIRYPPLEYENCKITRNNYIV